MWKALGINSKDGSELIGYMLNERLIKRTIIKIGSRRTFLLESAMAMAMLKELIIPLYYQAISSHHAVDVKKIVCQQIVIN